MWINRTSLFKSVDAVIGPSLCRILGTLNCLVKRKTSAAGIRLKSIRRILVIRPGGMGDMIVLLPVIKVLQERFPEAVIDLVCEKRNVDVLKLAGIEKNVVAYDSNPLRFLWQLTRQEYDVAVDTEQFHHFSAVFALISGAHTRIGFKINPRRNPLYTHLINYAPDGSEGEQFLKLLEPLDIKTAEYSLEGTLSNLEIPLPPLIKNEIEKLSDSGLFVVVHPGSSTPYKLWPPENFVELVRLLHERHGFGIVFAGDGSDRNVTTQILSGAKKAGYEPLSYVGKLNLAMTAAVMKQAGLFIGTDSGLAHLAVALGLPTVVLFGPSDHLKWGVENSKHAIVRKTLPCSPCFIFGYHKPCLVKACMRQISVEDVLTACQRIMMSDKC